MSVQFTSVTSLYTRLYIGTVGLLSKSLRKDGRLSWPELLVIALGLYIAQWMRPKRYTKHSPV